jgi:hypothetical protein
MEPSHRQRPAARVRPRLGGVAIVIALAMAGCGGPSHQASAPPSSTSSTISDGQLLVATYADNGATLTVHLHNQIKVELAGMAWTFEPSSNNAVVDLQGPGTTLPASTGCIYDVGCGSVSAFFTVEGTGRVTLHAARANCAGTSGNCVTGPQAFTLTVAVLN